jgi:hypothetical protein
VTRFARRRVVRGVALLSMAALVAVAAGYWRARQVREALYAAFSPVPITNCELRRFGAANDGGYLLCGNLLTNAAAAYSYGINGDDAWGCAVAAARKIPLHQYDCFNTQEPPCDGGVAPRFHPECIGPERETIDGRPFDSFASHLERNGHVGQRLIVKMDVEGSEWRSLATAPKHVLHAIDQLAIEFHGVEDAAFLETAARLNEFFYVAHIHYNNYECGAGFEPFASRVFEALLVNKRIAVANPWVSARGPSPLDAPNNPNMADCQDAPDRTELQQIAGWLRRKLRP